MEGGSLVPGTVHLTNNLYVLDGVTSWLRLIDPAFVTNNNIVASYSGPQDSNYVNLGFANIAGTAASDFDLVNANSPVVDAGADIDGLDFIFQSTETVAQILVSHIGRMWHHTSS
jgi:hypothetical protein